MEPILAGMSGGALKAVTKGIIEKHFLSKINKWIIHHQANKKVVAHAFSNQLVTYLNASYEANSFVSTIVFRNKQKKLLDLYIPLTLKKERHDKETYYIDSYKEEIFEQYKRIVIIDYAGMGKSTILKFMFLSCIENSSAIPVLIELRKLKKGKSVIDAVISSLQTSIIDEITDIDKEFILMLIERGDFVFMLDGFDEIEFEHRSDVIQDLHEFIKKVPKSYFVLTSRDDLSLTSFSSFQSFSIKKLEQEESFNLIRKYDENGTLSENLIKKLQEPELSPVHSFLENPLLTSLLYKSYEHKPTIPYRKDEFYRQVYDALFDSHDIAKDGSYIRKKKTSLSIEPFHKILRSIGFLGMKLGKISYSRDEIITKIEEAKHLAGFSHILEEDFLYDVCNSVPIFLRDGDQYKWAHKSLQDYFSACYICYDAKESHQAILEKMSQGNRVQEYYNVLDLIYDIDTDAFHKYILKPVLESYVEYFESSYSHMHFSSIENNALEDRKDLIFCSEFFLHGKSHFHLPGKNRKHSTTQKFMDDENNDFYTMKNEYKCPRINGLTMSMTVEFPQRIVGMSISSKPASTIIEIIDKKGVDITRVISRDESIYEENRESLFESGGLVNDSPDFPGNTESTFCVVNDLMKCAYIDLTSHKKKGDNIRSVTVLSYKKAKEELEKLRIKIKVNSESIKNLEGL